MKGKQGEKKTPREKLATQSELLELYAEQEAPGRETIPGLQLGEGTWWEDTGPVVRRGKLGYVRAGSCLLIHGWCQARAMASRLEGGNHNGSQGIPCH